MSCEKQTFEIAQILLNLSSSDIQKKEIKRQRIEIWRSNFKKAKEFHDMRIPFSSDIKTWIKHQKASMRKAVLKDKEKICLLASIGVETLF